MPILEQVRVFISSTFRDMHAERDHLVTVVFPELRERVEQLGLEFFDVDLRWGVPAKDANGETANSWEYCRQWIDRVEPFFVCILGQRYGWVPGVKDFKDAADQARQEKEPRSITDLEVRHAVLDTKRKRRSYFYLRATDAPADASEYVDTPPLLDKLVELKNEVRACGRPVRDYPCQWSGSAFTGMEEFGRQVLEDLWSGVLRDERYVSKEVWSQVLGGDPDTDPRYTDESQPVPRELWEKIVKLAKPPPKDPLDAEREQMEAFAASRLRWFQGRTHELQQLTDFINSTAENAPRLAVVAAVPGQGKSALLAKLSTLNLQPSTFQITHFVGATERSATAHALVERLLGELDRSGIEWPADEQKEGEEPKRDFNSLCLRLARRLGDYAGDRRIVILLDALNQLTDGHNLVWLPHRLGPSVRVVVSCVEEAPQESVVSSQKSEGNNNLTPEARVLNALASRQPAPLRVPLGPLTETDVRTIVTEYLHEYCKELDHEHVEAICQMEQARNPLYLLVLLGELRTLGGNDMNRIVGERIAALSHDYPDTVSLFRWVLQRLEVFGAEAVRWWCLYLAHGRVGMASHELADLLACKLGANAVATALLIERGLRRYLLRRGGQLDFFHGQLRQAVMEQYGSQAEAATVHHEMANYFTACANGTDPQKEWETDSVRGFAECVFHLTKAGQHEQAAGLLSSFPFLLHKLRVGLLEGVFEEYDMVRREASAELTRQLEIWTDFFSEKAHILRRGNDEWPAHKILLQLAVEHADDSPLTIGAEQWLEDNRCNWLWLRRVPRLPHVQKNPCLAVFEGHTDEINGALALADGRLLSWSKDKTLRLWDGRSGACRAVLEGHTGWVQGALELSDGRLLSWAQDNNLRLWDGKSGACRAVLEGHTFWVKGALALSDGRLLSWALENTVRIWDSKSGVCRAVLEGHAVAVGGALELSDGRLLSWAGNNLLIWDGKSGVCRVVLEGHTAKVQGALELSDGRLLSWALDNDNTLRLWDGKSGACRAILEGHTMGVQGALELSDGRLLSWADDDTLLIWDGKSGACRAILEGHTMGVQGALELSDGRLLSWAEYNDNTLRLWDGKSGVCRAVLEGRWMRSLRRLVFRHDKSGVCRAVLEGHTAAVGGALELSDGRRLSWAGDNTLRLWDGKSGACRAILEGHTAAVGGALELSDGRLLSWAEYKDNTLRLWDGQSGARVAVPNGHSGYVYGALELSGGRLLSWSYDETLRLWDGKSGVCRAVLEGHTGVVGGALALGDGRLLSWAGDNTLRLWDGQSGACVAVLNGHSGYVYGALELSDGRLLSWADDETLRLWDGKSGVCRAVLEGHTGRVGGALALSDGRLLSWSYDKTLRLWDGKSGVCRAALEGHTDAVEGSLELSDGRLLSWAGNTLRLWDGKSGVCRAVLKGHTWVVLGALELSDGRLLSWASNTLRLWDGKSGVCRAVLQVDTDWVQGALELSDGRLLSWASNTLRLWDGKSGACLETILEDHVAGQEPELLHTLAKAEASATVFLEFFVASHGRMAYLRHKTICPLMAAWNADSDASARCLLVDGTAVVTQDNGQVCFLKLHHGNRHISLADAEAILAEQGKLSAISDQPSVT